MLRSVVINEVETTDVVPGITRRTLPSGQVQARVFDMAPNTTWPSVDHHESDESIYVVSGELIEGQTRFAAGSYLHYSPGTSHQPRTETGVRTLVSGSASV